MDPKLLIPWKRRILQLRLAIMYLRPKFARVLGVNTHTLMRLEKGELEPNVRTIRRIRLLEHAFDEELAEYFKQVRKWGAIWTWGKEENVYEKYGGYKHKKVAVGYATSNIVPRRKADYEALGGMGVWGNIQTEANRAKVKSGSSPAAND
jgi:DNA-binding XRE family transcriptional regulator